MRRAMARRRDGGFTLVEIMMAVTVMTVGALGVMALQQVATRGNMGARQLTTATQVTRTWVERLRRDAVQWTQRGQPDDTRYLSGAPATGMGEWQTPVTPPGDVDPQFPESFGFDYFGNDTTVGAEMVYCTHVRYRWLIPGDTLRAEVRTFWHRREGDKQQFQNCAQGEEDTVTNALAVGGSNDLSAVYAATVIRRIPPQP
ncbi:MAG: type IV pilus modification PilV family protein [Myxococcota bacterium]